MQPEVPSQADADAMLLDPVPGAQGPEASLLHRDLASLGNADAMLLDSTSAASGRATANLLADNGTPSAAGAPVVQTTAAQPQLALQAVGRQLGTKPQPLLARDGTALAPGTRQSSPAGSNEPDDPAEKEDPHLVVDARTTGGCMIESKAVWERLMSLQAHPQSVETSLSTPEAFESSN